MVLCSNTTKHILMTVKQIDPNCLVSTPVNDPQLIELEEDGTVRVTLIPSDHCPGSVMFLIEGLRGNVLFTGDTMLEQSFVYSLHKNPFLMPYMTRAKQLDMVYFDSTFSYRGEPYIQFLPNSTGLSFLLRMLSLYPDDAQFYFADVVAGFEEAWLHVLVNSSGDLHCSQKVLKYLEVALSEDDTDFCKSDMYRKLLEPRLNQKYGRFHVCGPPDRCNSDKKGEFAVVIKQCINISLQEFSTLFPVDLEVALSEGAKMVGTTELGHKMFSFNNKDYLLSRDGKELLPSYICLPFSRHASYEQCVHLIDFLRPIEVYGCTFSRESWLAGASMARLFGRYCTGNQFVFDTENEEKYGAISIPGLVSMVNKWEWRPSEFSPEKPSRFKFMGIYQNSVFGSHSRNHTNQTTPEETNIIYTLDRLFSTRRNQTKMLIHKNRIDFEGVRRYRMLRRRDHEDESNETPGASDNEQFLDDLVRTITAGRSSICDSLNQDNIAKPQESISSSKRLPHQLMSDFPIPILSARNIMRSKDIPTYKSRVLGVTGRTKSAIRTHKKVIITH
ncbi:unnamed protein product [Kuraishia capsulata CBS 1993]|uniref:DNA repair metallo-beta-lactamase domain-containing protein n=1 Tax=Kuraishia capsulata CBS 1993 TaxID=1382522 RepID=W6MKG8_9ASCO|nr:uncharacterized protein KUCA_T00001159001 [Kuraishia capsulata CBS 1993]CDK25192.1 unnamed protein product [Kuraishia capsulata CBS 1993]